MLIDLKYFGSQIIWLEYKMLHIMQVLEIALICYPEMRTKDSKLMKEEVTIYITFTESYGQPPVCGSWLNKQFYLSMTKDGKKWLHNYKTDFYKQHIK